MASQKRQARQARRAERRANRANNDNYPPRKDNRNRGRNQNARYMQSEVVPDYSNAKMKSPFIPRTTNQAILADLIQEKTLTFAEGCAGAGKTAVTIGVGLTMLFNGQINQLIMTKTEFQIDGKHQVLPGDEHDKYAHHFANMRENAKKFITGSHLEYLEKKGQVKFVILGDILGKTYDRALILLDEGQISTIDQVRALLTRIGHGTSVVIAGDYLDQNYRGPGNGMEDAARRFRGSARVGTVRFEIDDIVRDDFVKEVVQAYRRRPADMIDPPAFLTAAE